MTKHFEEKCWNCGKPNMENMGEYFKCRSCSATWNEIRKIGSSPLLEERDPAMSPPGERMIKTGSPSTIVKRHAAKARSYKTIS